MDAIKIIRLKDATGSRESWQKPTYIVYLWYLTEWLLVTNALQPSSRLRILALKLFGAKIGEGVIFRPRTRVKFPWNLEIGDNCWVGEGVWFHNQAQITIGHDTCISQETFLTTGTHAHRSTMDLITSPIKVGSGVWLASRVLVTAGATIGDGCLVSAHSIVKGTLSPGSQLSTSQTLTSRTWESIES